MLNTYVRSKDAAEVSRAGMNLYSVQDDAACESWLPHKRGRGKSRTYSRNHLLLLTMHTSLVKFGMSIPFAGKLVERIAETLFFAPAADELVIEYHLIGASFFYGTARGDLAFERADAARLAGPALFRVALNLSEYRRAVDNGFALYGRPIGDDDAE